MRAEELLGRVSHKVVELEKALDVRLLERSTRSVRLTGIGESYFRRCQRGLDELEAANLAIEDRQHSGVLRLSVPPSLSDGLFVPIIAEFQRSYPKAQDRRREWRDQQRQRLDRHSGR